MRGPLIFVIFLVLQGCKTNYDAPCRAPQTFNDYLGSDELHDWTSQLIFSPRYLSQSNDTFSYVLGQSLQTFTKVGFKNNPECPPDSIGYEILMFPLTDSVRSSQMTATFQKSDSLLRIAVEGSVFEYSFSKLFVGDYVTIDSLLYFGKSYPQVFVAKNTGGDSLYYTKSSGVVRFAGSLRTLTRLP